MTKKINFEGALERLEEIVRQLEEGDVPLEKSIQLYEEGMKLGKKCHSILDKADRRIKQLSEDLKDDDENERGNR
jgi:exodeoxyribonuclease VII small subunit